MVIAGGYDLINPENVEYHKELEEMAKACNFTYQTIWPESTNKNETEIDKDAIQKANIIFLLSFSENQRTYLLRHSKCLIYTPTNEHFGIVPVEAMYSGLAVIAIESGGPKESVVHGKTGFLCPSDDKELSEAAYAIIYPEKSSSTKYKIDVDSIPSFAKDYVIGKFGFEQFRKSIDDIVCKMYEEVNKEKENKKNL